ncbi:MAG TPA: thermosome subunit, partial [Halobacteriales archaeon]|nr:thermosome subunit [Halobacteriales archaeon]
MAQQLGGQPLIVLAGGAQRTSGRDAQSMNITAGKAVAEAIRTTLGPRGMDKMLVDSSGTVVVTNDGATILAEMDIDHPAANMIVEVAKTQEDEVADGTTTAVVLAGEFLHQAETLLTQKLHPTTVTQGYRQAATKAKEILDGIATDVSKSDTEILEKIASTAMTGKGAESAKDLLSQLVVEAVTSVSDEDGIDLDNIRIKKAVGGAINESELVEGVLIQKERVQENMPYYIEDAHVAVYGGKFEVRETELDSEVNVSDPAELQLFLDQEQQQLKDMVDKLVELKANVLFTDAGIHDVAQHFLAEAGILAVRRTKASDQKAIARATGARIVTNFDDIKETDLGHAGEVVQQDLGGDQHIFITDVKDAKAVTLILRGGTEHVVDEVERAIDDSLGVVRATIEDGKVVAGGGSPELEVALGVRDFAESVGGREQLAI